MDAQKVDMFMITSGKFFPQEKIIFIKERLLSMDERHWNTLVTLQFKDPTTALIISIFLGSLGIDRFYIGDTGLGVGKLLTGGGCGVWTIIDWFLIMNATKEKNFELLANSL